MTLTRVAALGLAALAGYAAVVMTVPGQASAATAYRYWAYYVAPTSTAAHGATWQYSPRGPATEYPVDGEVQGWRFAVQVDTANGLAPRAEPDFSALCASTPAKAGDIRVGVVIDFGLASDAPAHEKPPAGVVPGCVNVRDGATGADVIEAAGTVRIGTGSDVGLVCGIDGYPKTQCAVAVAAATPVVAPSPTPPRVRPRAPVSIQATTPSAAAAASATAAPVMSAAAASPAASSTVPSPVLAQSPLGPPSRVPASASASALSLASLRSNTRHNYSVSATTIGGVALIVSLGAAAIWRTRARGR